MNKNAVTETLNSMKEYFDRSTRMLEEADSGFAPKKDMFTAAQQVAHAAQTIEWFIQGIFAPAGFDLNFERIDKEVRSVTSLGAARKWMERALAAAIRAAETHTEGEWAELLPENPIMGVVPRYAVLSALTDHTAHHRGALTVYSRLLGKVPPMPYADNM
jgi:uncharacterized damage-inducible protein DinB